METVDGINLIGFENMNYYIGNETFFSASHILQYQLATEFNVQNNSSIVSSRRALTNAWTPSLRIIVRIVWTIFSL